MISANTKTAQIENGLSQEANPGLDTAESALTTSENDGAAAAGEVRHDLGLPPVPKV